MSNTLLNTLQVLNDRGSGRRYRVLSIRGGLITMIRLDLDKISLVPIDVETAMQMLAKGQFIKEDEELGPVVDTDSLSENTRKSFEKKKEVMDEVAAAYGPDFTGLEGRGPKPELVKILEKHEMPASTFWPIVRRYLQSGMKDSVLVHIAALQHRKGPKNYSTKPGPKTDSGVLLTDEDKAHFAEGAKYYKDTSSATLEDAFTYINTLYYRKPGNGTVELLDPDKRPTKCQFVYYMKTHMSSRERSLKRLSAQQYRNQERLLTGSSDDGVWGPFDMAEADACHLGFDMVSIDDPNQGDGQPIVYFLVDVATYMIMAVFIGLEENSVLGLKGLFMNIAEDKHEFCAKYGLGFEEDWIWPSGVYPSRLRFDRGSDFRSEEINQMCKRLNIQKDLLPGGTPSLKGMVEKSFDLLKSNLKPHLEKYGYIDGEHGSKPQQKAVLDLNGYSQLIVNFVISHNQKYNKNLPLTPEMKKANVLRIPAALWEYGMKHNVAPRTIPDKNQFLYNIMQPFSARLTKKGILFKDLWYFPFGDPDMFEEMAAAGRHRIPINVRVDPRCINAVYYVRKSDGRLMCAPLNPKAKENREYDNQTLAKWEEELKNRRKQDKKGQQLNEQTNAYNFAINETIVRSSLKAPYPSSKNIKESRKKDRQALAYQDRISKVMDPSVFAYLPPEIRMKMLDDGWEIPEADDGIPQEVTPEIQNEDTGRDDAAENPEPAGTAPIGLPGAAEDGGDEPAAETSAPMADGSPEPEPDDDDDDDFNEVIRRMRRRGLD